MWYVLAVLGGMLAGAAIVVLIGERKPVGTLYFYQNEPGEDPIMTAELLFPPSVISRFEKVIFKVSHR